MLWCWWDWNSNGWIWKKEDVCDEEPPTFTKAVTTIALISYAKLKLSSVTPSCHRPPSLAPSTSHPLTNLVVSFAMITHDAHCLFISHTQLWAVQSSSAPSTEEEEEEEESGALTNNLRGFVQFELRWSNCQWVSAHPFRRFLNLPPCSCAHGHCDGSFLSKCDCFLRHSELIIS